MLITFTDEVARRNIFFLLVGCFVQEFVVHCLLLLLFVRRWFVVVVSAIVALMTSTYGRDDDVSRVGRCSTDEFYSWNFSSLF